MSQSWLTSASLLAVLLALSLGASLAQAGQSTDAGQPEDEKIEEALRDVDAEPSLQSQPAPPPQPAAATLPQPQLEKRTEAGSLAWLANRRRPGAYVGIALARPQEIGKRNYYDVLYGKKENQLSLFAGYYLYSYLVDFGLGTNIAYSSSRGYPVKSIPNGTIPLNGDLPPGTVLDRNQELELTLMPIQFLAQLAVSPFASRRVVLRAWGGIEELYVQETLRAKAPAGKTLDSDSKNYSNKGWNRGTVFGAMLSFSLSGLEPRSDFALKSLGIDRTFISPFLEIVKTTDAKLGNFDRRAYGIAFNFESLR